MKTRIAVLSIVLACSVPLAMAQVTVPSYVNYQGTLSDAGGQPLATGHYTMSFSVFPSATATTATWGPQVFDGVAGAGHGSTVYVSNGVFNVVLGPVDTLNRTIAGAFVAADRYIEITIGTNPPIQPRQQILAAPYAFRSGDGVPVGGIVPFFGNPAELPPNWRICDGSTVNDTYSPLNGVAVPDLRNWFLRGESSATKNLLTQGVATGGVDTTALGTSGSNGGHPHSLSGRTAKIFNDSDSPDPELTDYTARDDNQGWSNSSYLVTSGSSSNNEGHHYHVLDGNGTADSVGNHTHTVPSHENRPAFKSVHFIIRIR